MAYEIQNDKIKKNLSRIYHNSYLHNVGIGFRIWHIVLMDKRNKIWAEEEKQYMKKFEGL
jgi:hypothetical protein